MPPKASKQVNSLTLLEKAYLLSVIGGKIRELQHEISVQKAVIEK